MLLDTHAHLDFDDFDADRAELLLQMRANGIAGAIVPSVSPQNWSQVIELAKQHQLYYGLGIHPWWMTVHGLYEDMTALSQALDKAQADIRLVAIGETGLDGSKGPALAIQLEYLKRHLALAEQYRLPIILHCVKAYIPLIELLRQFPQVRGVVHGFGGSLEVAQEFVQLGFYIGIGGLILNHNAKKLRRCVTHISDNYLLPETDSPAMAPKGIDRNTPMLLPQVVDEIARLRGCSVVSLKKQLVGNITQLFEL